MRRAYLLAEAMIAIVIAGIVAAVFTAMNYYTYLQANLLKQQNSKTILEVVRSRLLSLAADPDNDSYFELLKEDAGNTVPADAGMGADAWGHALYYATVDLGVSDGTNAPYADTTTAISPSANVCGRLVSPGEDGLIQTDATHGTAQGDDLMLEIGIGELNHFKLYGGSEITGETRGYNSAVVSGTEPASPINGTLWYDTNSSKLKIYNSVDSNWSIL